MAFDFLLSDMHHYFYVFARVLGLFLGMPFLSQVEIPFRFRAVACAVLTFAFSPLVPDDYFPENMPPIETFVRFSVEFLLGLFLGLIARFALAAVEFAGSIIGFACGLSMAVMYNPSQSSQGSVVSVFLSMAAVTIFLVVDGHHYLLENLLRTYTIFSSHWFSWDSHLLPDLFKGILDLSDGFFRAGLSMSIPFLLVNSILQIALGIIGKLIPQVQVFFISMSLQVIIGWVILMMCLGTILLNYQKLTLSMYIMAGLDHG